MNDNGKLRVVLATHNAGKMANVNAVFAVTGIYIFFFVCRGFVVDKRGTAFACHAALQIYREYE